MLRHTRTVAVPLIMRRFSRLPEDLDDGGCLACEGSLDLHQPDAGSPDRIVGICMNCGRWYLLDAIPGTDEAVMFLLPDGGSLLKAEGADQPDCPDGDGSARISSTS
jgi:hypothetical protein